MLSSHSRTVVIKATGFPPSSPSISPSEEENTPIALLVTSSNLFQLQEDYYDDSVSLALSARLNFAIPEYVTLEEQIETLKESEDRLKALSKRGDILRAELRGLVNEVNYLGHLVGCNWKKR